MLPACSISDLASQLAQLEPSLNPAEPEIKQLTNCRRRCSFLVLDEGDKMLDDGFEEEVVLIGAEAPADICRPPVARRDKQVLFFSATWPPSVERAALRLCSRGGSGAPGSRGRRWATGRVKRIEEIDTVEMMPKRYILGQGVPDTVNPERSSLHAEDNKLPVLLRYLEEAKLSSLSWKMLAACFEHCGCLNGDYSLRPVDQIFLAVKRLNPQHVTPMHLGGGKVLVFVKTRNAADELSALVMQRFGGKSDAIHGQRKQEQRETSLRHFRTGSTRALITTDVLGRGVDIPDAAWPQAET
eukprot:Skav207108  [mRNA]  locus=scaffold156:130896:133662:- [translate_table: standard]